MASATIYARRDGRFTARFTGTVTTGTFKGGTVACASEPGAFATEQDARRWLEMGAERDGVALPDAVVVRRDRRGA